MDLTLNQFSIEVPSADLKFFKSLAKKMGWHTALLGKKHARHDVVTNIGDASVSASRKAKVISRGKRTYSDAELARLLDSNPDLPEAGSPNVKGIIAGGKGKALNSFKHWM